MCVVILKTKKMNNKLQELIATHRILAGEVFHALNELNQMDLDKFSDREAKDMRDSINDLENELSLRRGFISDLETLI